MNIFLKKFWFVSFSILSIIQGVYFLYLYFNYSHSVLFPGPIGLLVISLFLVFIYKTNKIINRTLQYILFSLLTVVYFVGSIILTSCLTLRVGCEIGGLIGFFQIGILIFIPVLIIFGLLVKFSKTKDF